MKINYEFNKQLKYEVEFPKLHSLFTHLYLIPSLHNQTFPRHLDYSSTLSPPPYACRTSPPLSPGF